MKLYFYIFEKVAVFCFAGEAGEAGDHPLSSTLFARGGVMSLATVISGYSGGGQHCPVGRYSKNFLFISPKTYERKRLSEDYRLFDL